WRSSPTSQRARKERSGAVARANSSPSRRERSAADPAPERTRTAARAATTSSRPSVASAAGAAALHASSTAAGPTPNRSRPERPERNRSVEATAPGGTARRKSASLRTFSVRERVAATASETATSAPNRVIPTQRPSLALHTLAAAASGDTDPPRMATHAVTATTAGPIAGGRPPVASPPWIRDATELCERAAARTGGRSTLGTPDSAGRYGRRRA